MSISIGNQVPDLELEAYVASKSEPKRLRLADYHGSWVVLFFYPRDFTFICPTELSAFSHLSSRFEDEDAVVLAASTDSYWSHKAWFESHPALASVQYPVPRRCGSCKRSAPASSAPRAGSRDRRRSRSQLDPCWARPPESPELCDSGGRARLEEVTRVTATVGETATARAVSRTSGLRRARR